MNWQLWVHYLDLARHEGASTFGWEQVKANIGAGVWWAVIVFVAAGLLYPPFRKAMERIAHKANAELHAKLDHNATLLKHVIRHSDQIPNEDRHGNLLVDLPPVKKAPRKRVAKKASPK